MKTIEHKHVRHVWGWRGAFSKKYFHEALMKTLDEQGKDGWELKGVIYELGFHAHFIFARQVDNDHQAQA